MTEQAAIAGLARWLSRLRRVIYVSRHPVEGSWPVPDHWQPCRHWLRAVEGDQVGGLRGVNERACLSQVGDSEVAREVHALSLGGLAGCVVVPKDLTQSAVPDVSASGKTRYQQPQAASYAAANALTETSSTGSRGQ